MAIYPPVICYITMVSITMLFMGKLPILTGPFSSVQTVTVITRGYPTRVSSHCPMCIPHDFPAPEAPPQAPPAPPLAPLAPERCSVEENEANLCSAMDSECKLLVFLVLIKLVTMKSWKLLIEPAKIGFFLPWAVRIEASKLRFNEEKLEYFILSYKTRSQRVNSYSSLGERLGWLWGYNGPVNGRRKVMQPYATLYLLFEHVGTCFGRTPVHSQPYSIGMFDVKYEPR